MTDWRSVEEARALPGLRLVLTAGVPGPWGEAAKALFHVKGIPFVRVRQDAAQANHALRDWTGFDNAPIAVWDDERPRAGWSEQIQLAERLAPEPRLVPDDPAERALLFGLVHELAGEGGLGWSRRLEMLHGALTLLPPDHPAREVPARLAARYGYSPLAAAGARARVLAVLRLFAARLAEQRAAGRRFLLGDALTALDLYWAAFAALLRPLPPDQCAMPEMLRGSYTVSDAEVLEAAGDALLAHRDAVYRDYLELPVAL